MSLINDALKRTKEAQQQTAPAAAGPELKPIDPANGKSASGPKALLYIMVACVIFGNLLILLYYFTSGGSKQPNSQATTATAPATTPSSSGPIAPEPARPAIAPVPPPTSTPELAVNPVPPETVTVAGTNQAPAVAISSEVPEAPKPAPLRLQSIMVSRDKPAALISGKFVNLGSKVQGFVVTAIDEETVTLVGNGQTNVLSLP